MSELSVVASSVIVVEDAPDALGVVFMCDAVGPYRCIILERAYWPAPGDENHAPGQVSLDLDLRPVANLDCTAGAITAVRFSPGCIELRLREELRFEVGKLQALKILFDVDESLAERLHAVLQLMFEGTGVTPSTLALPFSESHVTLGES